jgi:hypothetical protein
MICQQYAVVISAMSHLFPFNSQSAVWHDMIRYTLEQSVFLYDTYVKYSSAGKCWQKFYDERVCSRQTIHNLVNKLITM